MVTHKGSGVPPGASLAAQLLHAIAQEALAACDPAGAVRRAVHARPDHLGLCGRAIAMEKKGRLLLLAYGKAAPAMTAGFLQRFKEAGGRRALDGLVIHPRREDALKRGGAALPPALQAALEDLRLPASRCRLKSIAAEHPLPLRSSFEAGKRALRFA
ncbi:MAG: DUF4147 domain-containing protein, partial [Acidobacteria bacterium]|nr:DUF4147 domain-containing protein [Acidobacteriota bacterium]